MMITAITHLILVTIGVTGFVAANGLVSIFEKNSKYEHVEKAKKSGKFSFTSWVSKGNYFYPIGLLCMIFIVYWIYNPNSIVERGDNWEFTWLWGFLEFLMALYFCAELLIDMKYRTVTNPAQAAGLVLAFLVGAHRRGALATISGGVGALVISGLLYTAARIYTARFQSSPTPTTTPFGTGDIVLAIMLGLITGYPHVLLSWLIIVYIGGIAGVLHIALCLFKNREITLTDLPLGAFLILGTLITIVIA